jgi:hypothetical protein
MSGESFLLYQSFWIIIEKVFRESLHEIYHWLYMSIFIQDDRHHNAHCSSWADKPAANQGTAFTTTCRQDHLLDYFANVTTCHQDLLQDFWWLIIPSRISNRKILSPTTANSAVQDQQPGNTITDIATCYLDPEPELDMTQSELDRHVIPDLLVQRESWQRAFIFANPPSLQHVYPNWLFVFTGATIFLKYQCGALYHLTNNNVGPYTSWTISV